MHRVLMGYDFVDDMGIAFRDKQTNKEIYVVRTSPDFSRDDIIAALLRGERIDTGYSDVVPRDYQDTDEEEKSDSPRSP